MSAASLAPLLRAMRLPTIAREHDEASSPQPKGIGDALRSDV